VNELGTAVDNEWVCGEPTVDALVREYQNSQYNNQIRPDCDDFASSGSTTHFSWFILNGGFADGNPHNPWGMVKNIVKYGLEQLYTIYFNPTDIKVTSGYRCPHGNASVPGAVPNSPHTHGIAVDLMTWSMGSTWSAADFAVMEQGVIMAGATDTLPYTRYPDHHLHAKFDEWQ
jgi:hypothetical protein